MCKSTNPYEAIMFELKDIPKDFNYREYLVVEHVIIQTNKVFFNNFRML